MERTSTFSPHPMVFINPLLFVKYMRIVCNTYEKYNQSPLSLCISLNNGQCSPTPFCFALFLLWEVVWRTISVSRSRYLQQGATDIQLRHPRVVGLSLYPVGCLAVSAASTHPCQAQYSLRSCDRQKCLQNCQMSHGGASHSPLRTTASAVLFQSKVGVCLVLSKLEVGKECEKIPTAPSNFVKPCLLGVRQQTWLVEAPQPHTLLAPGAPIPCSGADTGALLMAKSSWAWLEHGKRAPCWPPVSACCLSSLSLQPRGHFLARKQRRPAIHRQARCWSVFLLARLPLALMRRLGVRAEGPQPSQRVHGPCGTVSSFPFLEFQDEY